MKSVFAAMAILASITLASPATAADPTGTWRSVITIQNQQIENVVVLRLDSEGPTLTGGYRDQLSNREAPISQARFANRQLSFLVVREINGQLHAIKYGGTLNGDTITGTCKIDFGDRSQTTEWVARR